MREALDKCKSLLSWQGEGVEKGHEGGRRRVAQARMLLMGSPERTPNH